MILLRNIEIEGSLRDVLIQKGVICRIEPAGASLAWELAGDVEIMECSGKVAVPGFINMHTHAGMSLMRGVGEDMVFHDWLRSIWAIEDKFDADFVYWSTKVACLEMIRTGTTTFNDQYWFPSHARKAAVEMGLRPAVSFIFLDSQDPKMAAMQRIACQKLYEKSLDWGQKSIFTISIHSVYTVTEENILWAADFARDRGLRIHMHLAETAQEDQDCRRLHKGLSPTEYFDALGIFGPDVIAAHCLFLSDKDIEILGDHKVSCVHNINSNLKLASGYQFRFKELQEAGANVCLGTDGAASSNTVDMLEHMKNSAMVQKAWRRDPAALPLGDLLASATSNGAKALGINTGEIKEGMLADLSLVDLGGTEFISPAPTLANLVYAAHSNVITDVMAGGRWIMRNRQVPNEAEIIREARKVLKQI